jgi:hypothetical protein
MKKITLALLSAIGACSTAFGQTNIDVVAPPYNSSTQLRLPNGMPDHKTLRGCFLVTQAELAALTGSVINSVGFIRFDGTGPTPSAGTFTLYMENTSNTSYSKGTNFTTALVGMNPYYNGAFNVPVSTTTGTVLLSTPGFIYTGGGIYIAYEWEENTPSPNNNNNYATYAANNTTNQYGASVSTTATPAGNTMVMTNFRPVVVFNAVNTATNELSVLSMSALGKVDKLITSSQNITAVVKNSSNVAKTNFTVGLNVTGANPYSNVQTIANFAAGSAVQVSFGPYAPTVNGVSTMSISIDPDQISTNNSLTWTQEVTCDMESNSPPSGTYTSGVGFPGATGNIVNRVSVASQATLTGVRLAIAIDNTTAQSSKQVAGVVLDAGGALIAYSSNTLTIAAGDKGQWRTFTFNPPVTFNTGTNYHIGLAQITPSQFPLAYYTPDFDYFVDGFYSTPLAGGALTLTDFGYFGIQGIYSSSLAITASASKTLVCKGDPRTITLTATGADTYTWSFPGAGNSSTAAVTPTVGGAAGVVGYSVVGTNTTLGCSIPAAVILASVSACTGLNDLDNVTEISIFPNPAATNDVRITGLVGINSIVVFNSIGQVVLTAETKSETAELDLAGLAAGTYLVRITDDLNRVKTVKLGKQ